MKKYFFLIPAVILCTAFVASWLEKKYTLQMEVTGAIMGVLNLGVFGVWYMIDTLVGHLKLKREMKKRNTLPDFEHTPDPPTHWPLPTGILYYFEPYYDPTGKGGLNIPKPKAWTKPKPEPKKIPYQTLNDFILQIIPIQEGEDPMLISANTPDGTVFTIGTQLWMKNGDDLIRIYEQVELNNNIELPSHLNYLAQP